ncbi:SRPBCC domain-containing protein [Sphingobacterium sp. SRCM116780]|uniref:SRPBCC domain-containing protein n=1 Tax=Sphingobacterium sp. SRCM116780 TaxID=2907623 RepID=UPI001F39871B|nr:SRPBCC domain-containing protein [Sphingobacterium sp. SRCM116780]UIR55200.1 SRPBCC domain-containing protein [Sphingobacterium sp. SRCM116780]
MKINIESKITIHANIHAVWLVLADFNQYPTWSPTIKSFAEIPHVGKRSEVELEQPDGPGMTMRPLFLKIEPNEELRWKGRLLMNGLFDGEHYFILEKITDTETILIQGEIFSGVFVRFFQKMINGATLNGFRLFNEAIKSRAEEQIV